jgi:hypothetical protein
MAPIIRNVRDFKPNERRVLERVVGQQLTENQQLLIQVVSPANGPAPASQEGGVASERLWRSPTLDELALAQLPQFQG